MAVLESCCLCGSDEIFFTHSEFCLFCVDCYEDIKDQPVIYCPMCDDDISSYFIEEEEEEEESDDD